MTFNTIDDVIRALDDIIEKAMERNDPAGYFAALYRKVTNSVKEGIEKGFFDDNARMEQLDIIFAKRYIDAHHTYQNGKPVTASWEAAFALTRSNKAIVLQHLLMGMNAHINLDLGIAAAQISEGKAVEDLQNDFYRINQVLASLIDEVENDLSTIWPPLKKILDKTRIFDDYLASFSMDLARDGAWGFAKSLALLPASEWDTQIDIRDKVVAEKSKIVSNPGFLVQFVLWIVRLTEKGNVRDKIEMMS